MLFVNKPSFQSRTSYQGRFQTQTNSKGILHFDQEERLLFYLKPHQTLYQGFLKKETNSEEFSSF